jgi:predicted acyl esterase
MAPAWAALDKGPCSVKKETDVAAKMRDGTVLMADVYRPQESGSYPVLLMRLPYNKDAAQTYVYAQPEEYASHCYIMVIQDVRGQYKSQGEFYPFRDEGKDGYDTVEWAAQLPGSNGKVGIYGFSYVGATQWLALVAWKSLNCSASGLMTLRDPDLGQGKEYSLPFRNVRNSSVT